MTTEQLAAMAAQHVNGGTFVSGDFYSPGHRQKWMEAIDMVTKAYEAPALKAALATLEIVRRERDELRFRMEGLEK